MKYQSELIKEIVEKRGHHLSSPHYESECVESWIEEAKGAYPKLCDYESEWLNYINETPLGVFPYETLVDITKATVNNVVPYAYKSAILKGNTKYRDIDTGDILDAFDETKNLKLVSVKAPVLTTSNEDGTKTNILTVKEEVELRGIGEVKDELDCLTGEVVERIGEIVLDGTQNMVSDGNGVYIQANDVKRFLDYTGKIACDKLPVLSSYVHLANVENGISGFTNSGSYLGQNWLYVKINNSVNKDEVKEWLTQNPITVQYALAEESVKTVGLAVVNQDGDSLSKLIPIEGTMHLSASGKTINPLFSGEIPVEAITQNLASFIGE